MHVNTVTNISPTSSKPAGRDKIDILQRPHRTLKPAGGFRLRESRPSFFAARALALSTSILVHTGERKSADPFRPTFHPTDNPDVPLQTIFRRITASIA